MILNEERVIRRQLIKNMIYNFIVFSIIFTIFGIVIFNTVKHSIYQSSTRELEIAIQRLTKQDQERMAKPEQVQKEKEAKPIREDFLNEISPRVTYIIRDENLQISNTDKLGRLYEEFGSSISFDDKLLNTIYELKINNEYAYRGTNLKIEDEQGQVKYVQLLINIDAEKAIIETYLGILLVGICVTIVLSIIASYLLSKKALKPIISTWRKQTEFVQNASHELRTPLTIIQAKQELLLQDPDSKIIDKSEDIRLTLNEAKRLSKMTKDLMLLARADSQQDQLQKEEVEIDKMMESIVLPYMDFAQIEDKEIKLELEYKTKAKIDVNKIHQVMIILLDNAIKYTKEKDTITIHTMQKENKCIIEVKDTGIGISEEGIKHVFERFYREDKARTRKKGGSGLGLSIAQYIIGLHKGSIKISQNTPEGTIVAIRLPRG